MSIRSTTALASSLALVTIGIAGCNHSHTHGAPAPAVPTSSSATPTLTPPPTAASPVAASSTVATLPDACSLLTPTEAQALASTALNPQVESTDKTLCQYVGPTSGPEAQVEVIVGPGALKGLQIDRDVLKHTFMAVRGIADEADEESDNIFIRKGTLWVQINLVLLNDPTQNQLPLETAAKAIAGRM
jgi:hypothetical protein